MLTPTGMTAVKEGPVAAAEVPAAVAAPDAPRVAGAEPDQTDPGMYHLECNYQLTPYRKFGKMTAEPHKSAV
jgi:hypothetical protein